MATVRPRWMTALALFCAATAVFLAWRDLFVASARDAEVWFGLTVHGAAARWSAPLHWAIFAFGAWGAWYAKPWVVRAAVAYAIYVALSHGIWIALRAS